MHTAAEFSIPTTVRVAESESLFTVCIVMAATTPTAVLAREAVLSLTTIDGTG